MATATASATMAAAGYDKKRAGASSVASSLRTPGSGSGTFPSELFSPMASSPACVRSDDGLRTPITPPSAYLDFLNNFDRSFAKPPDSDAPQPSRAPSGGAAGEAGVKPDSPRIAIPPSAFVKPAERMGATSAASSARAAARSARTPRRLHIPPSPFPPAIASAHSLQPQPSPYLSTPLSAAPWSASFSPRESHPDLHPAPGSKVHVRHTLTRTVTYCRTPLHPAPKGKRRKTAAAEHHDPTPSPARADHAPPVKEEARHPVDERSHPSPPPDSPPEPSASPP